MTGRARHYWVETEGLPLSLKCPIAGRARYVVEDREVDVDDGGWLIVNEDQPYSIAIEAPIPVHTFVVWFPRGWVEEVDRCLSMPDDCLLTGDRHRKSPPHFFERYTPDDARLTPAVHALRARYLSGTPLEDGWLEEQLRDLLARMLVSQNAWRRSIARLPAGHAATREELWRRVNRGRDFIHAHSDTAVTLSRAARTAAMSPYHFLRTFKAAFGQTPHEWLTWCRIERAKRLLARTHLSVTEICLAVGYESVGSFSTRFHRGAGCSPRAWRQIHGSRRSIRNFREVFSDTSC